MQVEWGALDRLGHVAPVFGVLGGHNGRGEDEKNPGDRRVIDVGGLRVGVVHDLVTSGLTAESHPQIKPTSSELGAALESFFGERVDVLLYAGTHVPRIAWASGILMVNGGSPTLPADRPSGSLGTIAIVEVEERLATVWIVDLGRSDESTPPDTDRPVGRGGFVVGLGRIPA